MPVKRAYIFEWFSFALIATLVCLILAFRPIPNADSANDTVRYVNDFHEYCRGEFLKGELLNKEISYQFFYFVTSLACLTNSDFTFLFLVALFSPLMFILFSNWRNGTFIWACCLLFSLYGLELMTNAMRQGLAMLLFFGGIKLAHKNPKKAYLAAALAVAAHTSSLAYIPFLWWINGAQLTKTRLTIGIASALFFSMIGGIIYSADIKEYINRTAELHDFYKTIYAEQSNISFIIFMTAPLYFIYGLRHFLEKQYTSSTERKALIYSTILIMVFFIAFPAIAYRFTIFAVPLQIFLITLSDRHSFKVGSIATIGMITHLSIMIFISNNYSVLIYG